MKKWLNSAGYAVRGITRFIQTERNARIEIFISVVVIMLALYAEVSVVELSILLLCIGFVLAAEAMNSAVERMADFQSKEKHPDIKDIKDMAAGAVLISAIISLVIGVLILGPRLVEKIGSSLSI
jgi:diacylglycerol kinase